jgi:hypothetical protein
MTLKPRAGLTPAAALIFASLLPHAAAAQTAESAQISSGPMVVQRVGNSAFIAPDFKITDFNGKACGLVGAYGGWLAEQTFLIGAGGYWLTDTSHERDMWYFGLVTGVYLYQDRPVGVGFKALIGGGEATFGQPYTYLEPRRGGPPIPVTVTNLYHTGMFVFEPEADVVVHLNEHMKLTGGVGYRLTGDPYYGYYGYNGYGNNQLHGVTGSIALQIGSGF